MRVRVRVRIRVGVRVRVRVQVRARVRVGERRVAQLHPLRAPRRAARLALLPAQLHRSHVEGDAAASLPVGPVLLALQRRAHSRREERA